MKEIAKNRYTDINEHIKTSNAVKEWWRLRKNEQSKSG